MQPLEPNSYLHDLKCSKKWGKKGGGGITYTTLETLRNNLPNKFIEKEVSMGHYIIANMKKNPKMTNTNLTIKKKYQKKKKSTHNY